MPLFCVHVQNLNPKSKEQNGTRPENNSEKKIVMSEKRSEEKVDSGNV